jgi:hypothetical protein
MIQNLKEYIGAIHIHSLYSDGFKTIPEIVAYANDVGLDFLMFTDHHYLKPKRDGHEGWHKNVLVLIGYEINDRDNKNHYLAFNLDEEVEKFVPAKDYVRQVKEKGGFGIIAHPHEERNHMKEYPPYPWTTWNSEDFQGIEIWNQMSEWMEGLTRWNKLWRFLRPRKSIISPKSKTLSIWDELNLKRKVVGIGGVDAHGHLHRILKLIEVEVFPYKVQFKSIRTHILSDKEFSRNFDLDKKIIYNGILGANCFISHYKYGDARGFRFWVENSNEQSGMGQIVKLPLKGEIRLIKNGKNIYTTYSNEMFYSTDETGLYRVEVIRGKPWIFSNHIRIEN